MAKWKNLPVGTHVKVKKHRLEAAASSSAGRTGVVKHREPLYYPGVLQILVEFETGDDDWMHVNDVKLIKEEL